VIYGLGHTALDVAEAIWVKGFIASGGFFTGIGGIRDFCGSLMVKLW